MRLNGEELGDYRGTVEELITDRQLPRRGIAVAVDGAIIPRSEWSRHRLDGARVVEIVTAAAGG